MSAYNDDQLEPPPAAAISEMNDLRNVLRLPGEKPDDGMGRALVLSLAALFLVLIALMSS